MMEYKRFEDAVDTEREQEVETLFEAYAHRIQFPQVHSKRLVLEAYRVKKPMTKLEFFGQEKKTVEEFTNDMTRFFYVETHEYDSSRDGFTGSVFLSRFEHLPDVATMLEGMTDEYCDVAGVFYGIPLEHIAGYSQKHEKFK